MSCAFFQFLRKAFSFIPYVMGISPTPQNVIGQECKDLEIVMLKVTACYTSIQLFREVQV